MAVRLLFLALFVTACRQIETPLRIALLAPFEGRYREIGYNALYAARLAFHEVGPIQIELLPLDDGGTIESARKRVHALGLDPQVSAVLVLGYAGTAPETLHAFGDLPVLVIGYWDAVPINSRQFILSSPHIGAQITIPARAEITTSFEFPAIGSDIFSLSQFGKLHPIDEVEIISSARLADAAFKQRYLTSDQFVPEPGLLASLSYDAAQMAIRAVEQSSDRDRVAHSLTEIVYSGLNGMIRFENGFWADAPIHVYRYNALGELLAVDGLVE